MRIATTRVVMAAAMLAMFVAAFAACAEDGAHSRDAQAEPSGDHAAPADSVGGDPAAGSTEASAAHPGRQVFLDHNCALCHTAYARGIGELPEETGEGGEGAEDAVTGTGPPDLSALAATWTADLLRAYLIDRIEVDGAKHVTSFKGSDEEWVALEDWMLLSRTSADTAAVDAGAAASRAGGEK